MATGGVLQWAAAAGGDGRPQQGTGWTKRTDAPASRRPQPRGAPGGGWSRRPRKAQAREAAARRAAAGRRERSAGQRRARGRRADGGGGAVRPSGRGGQEQARPSGSVGGRVGDLGGRRDLLGAGTGLRVRLLGHFFEAQLFKKKFFEARFFDEPLPRGCAPAPAC